MKLKKDFVIYNMADDYMLIPTGEQIAAFSGTIVLNEVSAFIIKQMEKESKTVDQLVEAILAEYDVDAATARADVEKVVETLKNSGVIEDE